MPPWSWRRAGLPGACPPSTPRPLPWLLPMTRAKPPVGPAQSCLATWQVCPDPGLAAPPSCGLGSPSCSVGPSPGISPEELGSQALLEQAVHLGGQGAAPGHAQGSDGCPGGRSQAWRPGGGQRGSRAPVPCCRSGVHPRLHWKHWARTGRPLRQGQRPLEQGKRKQALLLEFGAPC